MKNTLIRMSPVLAIILAFIFLRKSDPVPDTVRAGFSNTTSSQIYFETQYRRGREYGIWYARDVAGNITAIQVLPLER